MLDIWESAVLVFAGVSAALIVSTYREQHIRAGYKSELDTVYSKLRHAEERIAVLEGQLDYVMRLVKSQGVNVQAGESVTIGGDAIGRDKTA